MVLLVMVYRICPYDRSDGRKHHIMSLCRTFSSCWTASFEVANLVPVLARQANPEAVAAKVRARGISVFYNPGWQLDS